MGTDSAGTTLGLTTATAAPADEPVACTQWEVRRDVLDDPDGNTRMIDSGWQPFAATTEYDSKIHVISRRCLN